ncbi:IS3 family transposase [Peptoniphilus sp.]|uniref:IS3 family transposase n=1 Tax=Peptoniphilus sp. TaxID=1971214 RepID=UPI002A83B943|nr:IS3 family transposase [Peptoniphilus sp.]MDY3902239.1 IS3 family transposase [Peptoniphilus sp.]
MPKGTNEPKKLDKSEREELIELRERNQYLEAELLYLKKLMLAPGEKISNKEKTKIVLELRQNHPKIMLKIAKLPRLSFYEWEEKLHQMDTEEPEVVGEIKEIISESRGTYEYRRATIALRKKGIVVNHKKVLRLMRENNLLCKKFQRRSRGYSSFKGEVGNIADNVLDRNFEVNKPNELWVSDVTEFKIHNSEIRLYLFSLWIYLIVKLFPLA